MWKGNGWRSCWPESSTGVSPAWVNRLDRREGCIPESPMQPGRLCSFDGRSASDVSPKGTRPKEFENNHASKASLPRPAKQAAPKTPLVVRGVHAYVHGGFGRVENRSGLATVRGGKSELHRARCRVTWRTARSHWDTRGRGAARRTDGECHRKQTAPLRAARCGSG